MLPPCPFLPSSPEILDWRCLNAHGEARDATFYLTALTYGHQLWQRGLAARAILCLDRAMGADLTAQDPVLAEWPMPYAPMAWFLTHTPPDVFIGNPRVHFQHYAGRLAQPRRDQRRWRAWACWALVRHLRPHLPGDPRHAVIEPTESLILEQLNRHTLPGEGPLWHAVLNHLPSPQTTPPQIS